MTHYPLPPIIERRRKLLRYIGMGLSGVMVVTVLTVFGLIIRSESAHDEQSCPFSQVSDRSLADARVVEEARECLSGVEERRWLVSRSGEGTYELARKRLEKARFSKDRFVWKLEADDKQRLVVKLEVDGERLSEFHEEDVGR